MTGISVCSATVRPSSKNSAWVMAKRSGSPQYEPVAPLPARYRKSNPIWLATRVEIPSKTPGPMRHRHRICIRDSSQGTAWTYLASRLPENALLVCYFGHYSLCLSVQKHTLAWRRIINGTRGCHPGQKRDEVIVTEGRTSQYTCL
jgi:hypothetical protein